MLHSPAVALEQRGSVSVLQPALKTHPNEEIALMKSAKPVSGDTFSPLGRPAGQARKRFSCRVGLLGSVVSVASDFEDA